jgi:hypothetical protein
MKNIDSRLHIPGDNDEIFHSIIGFKLVDISASISGSPEEPTLSLKFTNEHHVEIDVIIQESGVFVTEPFAVREDLSIADD